jgi:hypothetical protein
MSGISSFSFARVIRKVKFDVTHRDLAKQSVFKANCRLCGDAILSSCGP